MLDIENIRRMHKSDAEIVGTPFPSMQMAVLMFEQAHQHRGLLLDEVERLRRERDRAQAQVEHLETAIELLVAAGHVSEENVEMARQAAMVY